MQRPPEDKEHGMNIMAINGSPRKRGNTSVLLQHALDGAREAAPEGSSARLVHLYDHAYAGCRSCFACKRLGGKSYGRCAVRDGLAPLLEEVAAADALILGSPIYFGDVSGMLRCFLERLLFPFMVYDVAHSSLAPRPLSTACLYTMNVNEEAMRQWRYAERLSLMETFLARVFSPPKVLYVNDTLQFDDYSRYANSLFDPVAKRRRHEEHFPEDCRRARELGTACIASVAAR